MRKTRWLLFASACLLASVAGCHPAAWTPARPLPSATIPTARVRLADTPATDERPSRPTTDLPRLLTSDAVFLQAYRRAELAGLVRAAEQAVQYHRDLAEIADEDETEYLSRVAINPARPGAIPRDLDILRRSRERAIEELGAAEASLRTLREILARWDASHSAEVAAKMDEH